jgi:Zn-dependent protease
MSFGIAISLLTLLFLPIPLNVKDLILILSAFNIAIGLLSLIPANPLDGYKLFVGLLWSALGSEEAARGLIRRMVMPWVAVELVGTCFLLLEKPFLGTTAVAVAASLYGQRLYAHHRQV